MKARVQASLKLTSDLNVGPSPEGALIDLLLMRFIAAIRQHVRKAIEHAVWMMNGNNCVIRVVQFSCAESDSPAFVLPTLDSSPDINVNFECR